MACLCLEADYIYRVHRMLQSLIDTTMHEELYWLSNVFVRVHTLATEQYVRAGVLWCVKAGF